MRNRDNLYKKTLKDPTNENIAITYKRYRNFCTSILKKAKRSYEKQLVEEAQDCPQNSVDEVNFFFSNVGRRLAERNVGNLSTSGFSSVSTRSLSSLVMVPTDETEITDIIKQMKDKCAVEIMAPSKKSQEEIRRKKRECEKRRREKIRSDPHLYEQAKAKERERYKKRKEERKILPISQISERQQRKQRKEWRKRQKKCRENRKCRERLLSRLREDSPPSSDIENQPVRQSPVANMDSPSTSNNDDVRLQLFAISKLFVFEEGG
ncbi:hypothetical protein ACJJTC_013635 [Scirpophaga incertulas]